MEIETQTIVLSRLNIVQASYLTESTPQIVLDEIAHCHQIPVSIETNVSSFVVNVQNKPIGIIHDPPLDSEFTLLLYYVNPHAEWTPQELYNAYIFLKSWEGTIRTFVPNNFKCGSQVPHDISRLNACVMYKICMLHNVPLRRDTTMYQMANICQMLKHETPLYPRSVIYNIISDLTISNLIELYIFASSIKNNGNLITHESNQVPLDITVFDHLEDIVSMFDSKQFMRSRMTPKTHAEAIVLAALNYKLDISYAHNPVSEYQNIQASVSGSFRPCDPGIIAIYNINPYLIDMSETFNPKLPFNLYDDALLRNMAKREGYTDEDIRLESSYTLLQYAYVSETFYHGKQIGIKNEMTPIYLEIVNDINNNLIVCYGIKSTENMIAYRYKELSELFRINRNFINPATKELFSSICIAKLKNLSRIIRSDDLDEVIIERHSLYNSIIVTELFTNECNKKARDFYLQYESSPPEIKKDIINTLESLFYMSMYMRGWKGGDREYPIERAPVENQHEVDLNVTQAIMDFENRCIGLKEIGDLIMSLPLVKYNSGEYIAIASEQQGHTIADRLAIVKAGESHHNYNSCIRLTSNYFVMTSFRYMETIGLQLPFEIAKLKEIS